MATVIVLGSTIGSEGDLHRVIESALEFGPTYGRNLAALRDRLLIDVPRPVHIIWQASDMSRTGLGEDLWSRVLAIFDEAVAQDNRFGWADRFSYELA